MKNYYLYLLLLLVSCQKDITQNVLLPSQEFEGESYDCLFGPKNPNATQLMNHARFNYSNGTYIDKTATEVLSIAQANNYLQYNSFVSAWNSGLANGLMTKDLGMFTSPFVINNPSYALDQFTFSYNTPSAGSGLISATIRNFIGESYQCATSFVSFTYTYINPFSCECGVQYFQCYLNDFKSALIISGMSQTSVNAFIESLAMETCAPKTLWLNSRKALRHLIKILNLSGPPYLPAENYCELYLRDALIRIGTTDVPHSLFPEYRTRGKSLSGDFACWPPCGTIHLDEK